MPKNENNESYNFIISVYSISMKVKFPCKMQLQHNGNSLTHEVQSTQPGKFIFNQQVKVKQEVSKVYLELSTCLITEKGSKYISGLIKISLNVALKSEGQKQIISLSKCLDPEAFCQLRIDKVMRQKCHRTTNLTCQDKNSPRYYKQNEQQNNDYKSPTKLSHNDNHPVGQTRSEAHFPVKLIDKYKQQMKTKEYVQGTFPRRTQNRSPTNRNFYKSNPKHSPFEFAELDKEKLIEAEVYKDNYQKIKQKFLKQNEHYKTQLNKRLSLQNNQNNYKLEIVKQKLKIQELSKNLQEKNLKIKEFSASFTSFKQKEIDVNFMKEELMNKEANIHMLENTILTISQDNDKLRIESKEIRYEMEQKILVLENQLELLSGRFGNKEYDYEREIKQIKQQLSQKQAEISKKVEMLEKQKKSVYQLEKCLQNKLFQFDSVLQSEKSITRQEHEEFSQKLNEQINLKKKVSKQKSDLECEIEKLKQIIMKNDYDSKLFIQEITTLKNQLQQLSTIREKYDNLSKDHKKLSEAKVQIEKSFEKIIISKDTYYGELAVEYKRQIDSNKKAVKDLEQKSRQFSTKVIEKENQLQGMKNYVQKLKKNLQVVNKQLIEIKQKQKTARKSNKNSSEQIEQIKKQFNRYKQKSQFLNDNLKNELNKTKDQLTKLRIQYQNIILKHEQSCQAFSELNLDIARLKMSFQFSEEKYEKLNSASRQKYRQYEKMLKDHQNIIILLQDNVSTLKDNEKDYLAKLKRYESELESVLDKNDVIASQTKTIQEKRILTENSLKAKLTEISQVNKKLVTLEAIKMQNEQQINNQKIESQMNKNDIEKGKKMIQILQKDLEKFKQQYLNLNKKCGETEKQLQSKILESKNDKQEISSFETKNSNLKKQFQKYKQSINQAFSSTFSQILHSLPTNSVETKTSTAISSSSLDFANFNRKLLLDINNDIAHAISTVGKQQTNQINKLTQRIKYFEKQLQQTRNDSHKHQQSMNRTSLESTAHIQELQQLITNLQKDNKSTEDELVAQIGELEHIIRNNKQKINKLQQLNHQLAFTLNSIKLEYQNSSENSQGKIKNFRKNKEELQQQIEYLRNKVESLENKAHEGEVQLMNLNSTYINQKQCSYKYQLKIEQINSEKSTLQSELESLKKASKQTTEKVIDLEIQLTTVKDLKDKYESMLSQEQSKMKDLKIFSNNLMKQKENIIKKEVEKEQQITDLQNKIWELVRQKQNEEDLKNKLKLQLDESKQINRKMATQIKQTQVTANQEKDRYRDIKEKFRSKEREISEIKQQKSLNERKHEEVALKSKQNILELNEEIHFLTQKLETTITSSSETICGLQTKQSKSSQTIQKHKEQIAELEEALYVERENNQIIHQKCIYLKEEVQQTNKKIEQFETICQELMGENKQKDQHMYEIGSKIYQYQNRIKEMEEEKMREIDDINNSLNIKYDEDYQQICGKIEFIEKQKEYLKEKLAEKDEQISKKNQQIRYKQIEQLQFKKVLEDKIKKIQEEKLNIFTTKNKEISKLHQQCKLSTQQTRSKESQIRKIQHELQISRSTIQKLDGKIKESQNEKISQVKAYQMEIDGLRKKEVAFKCYRDSIVSSLWNLQRQIRRSIQIFIKQMLENSQKQNRREATITVVKSLQENLLAAISSIIRE